MGTPDSSSNRATLQDWLDALESAGAQPKPQGRGFMARCPAHNDSNPSLHVSPGDSVPVIAKCFAGCQFKDIIAALNLGDSNGRPTPPRRQYKRKPPEPKKPQRLPSGETITRYYYVSIDGEIILAVVRRATPTGKTFSQWRPLEGDLWISEGLDAEEGTRPLYRLPDIANSSGSVAIVEGEKCVESVREYWPGQAVTTWVGGGNSWRYTDWQPLAGRSVALLADADTEGRGFMLALAEHLDGLGCKVKIGLPDGESGDDIADWLAIDHKQARERVKALLQDYKTADLPEPPAGSLNVRANRYYRLLGLAGDSVAIRIAAGRILLRTRESISQAGTLIAIAPLAFWSRLTDSDTLGTAQAKKVGDVLLRESDQLGQVDLATIAGRGAVRLENGEVAYHLGDRLFKNGVELPLDNDQQAWLAEPRLELGKAASTEDMRRIARAVMEYRWATPDDGRRLMGWIVAAIIGGALDWRPHLLMTAPAAQGKSWLIRHVVQKVMGPLLIRVADATPAALARLTAHSSLPIAIDEAEPTSPMVLEMLKLLRVSAGAEGLRIRADSTTGGVVTQAPRFAAMLSSTASPMLQRADATRLTVVRFGPAVDDWRKVSSDIRAAMTNADGARYSIIRNAKRIVTLADKITDDLQAQGVDSRESQSTAVLTAGWRAWGMDGRIVKSQPEVSPMSDAAGALLDILAVRMRVNPAEEVSLLDLLGDEGRETQLADLYGIRLLGDGLAIAPTHSGLLRALKRTPWEHVNLKSMLLQLDGIEQAPHPVRFARLRARALIVSVETLEALGVDTSELFERPGVDDSQA